MKQVVVFLVLVAVVVALPRMKRQLFGDQDPTKIKAMMLNEAHVTHTVNCLLLTDPAEVELKCDKHGKSIRGVIPGFIEKGDCPSACNEKEKQALAHMHTMMKQKYPALLEKLVKRYNVTPEHLKKLDDFVKGIPPM